MAVRCLENQLITVGISIYCLKRYSYLPTVNRPDKLAKTMLAHMVKCLDGGPELLAKILPVCGLDVESFTIPAYYWYNEEAVNR